jgi:DNA-binding NtrC family response regulator
VVPHAAPDYATAQRLAEEVGFRVAIIDALLPDGDGIMLGHLLKEQHEHLEVIYITGYASQRPDIQAVLRSPRMHLLEKPFAPRRLLDLVRSVVV